MDAPEKRRWYCPTPGWLIYGSLATTGLIWLSNWLGWPAWHKGYAVLAAIAGVVVVLAAMPLWWLAALVFRRRFQFSVRSLLVFALAVAFPCNWLAVERANSLEQRDTRAILERHGETTKYDYQADAEERGDDPEPPGLGAVRSLLGEDFFADVVSIEPTQAIDDETEVRTPLTDADLIQVANLKRLQTLTLDGSWISDAGLVHLAKLHQLQFLSLEDTNVTDAGLAHLSGLIHLRGLDLVKTKVTDAGLAYLDGMKELNSLSLCQTQVTDSGLPRLAALQQLDTLCLARTSITDKGLRGIASTGARQLQALDLIGTSITNAGLAHLTSLTQLRVLYLGATHVSAAGAQSLHEALPSCTIFFDDGCVGACAKPNRTE